MWKSLILVATVLSVAACGPKTRVPEPYSGTGGMTKKNVTPAAYRYHYDNGFTGVDAVGWDPNLQHAWSRLGAAETCGIAFSKPDMVKKLISEYGFSEIIHDLNGIRFHAVHADKVPDFCSEIRVSEARDFVRNSENGLFPKRY